MAYILSLDQGTTSSRAILFDENGVICAIAQKQLTQIYPQPGWVEHDPEEIWATQLGVAAEVLARAGISSRDVAAIGITNQRETSILWERTTSRPVHNAIVWQDRRTAPLCDRLRAEGAESLITACTGLVLDPYFSASKIAWLLENILGARERAERGALAFGTVDSWLAWKLTGGRLHITDASNASRAMLFNIHSGQWDEDLLKLFRIPRSLLPEVRSSSEIFGEVSAAPTLESIPIAGIAGDQQAALFGQLCVAPWLSKNTYGTGCFLLQNTGGRPAESRNRLLTTVAWKIGARTEYAIEGSVFIGGAVVQWLRDGLGIVRSAGEVEALASSVPDSGGVYLVPAFAGLGAPHWDSYARGALLGLTRGTSAAHVARAALEGIAFQVADLLEAMRADSGVELAELRVDGGASMNNLLLQIQADLLGVPVARPAVIETTALGAAYLAGLAVGVWKTTAELSAQWRLDHRFEPRLPRDAVEARREQWKEAVERSKGWTKKKIV